MKNFLSLLLSMFIFNIACAQSTSVTVYYDNNLKGVSDEAFATYKAVFAEPVDTNYKKQFVVKYLPTGKTQIEGEYYRYDKYDYRKNKYKSYRMYTKDGVLKKTIEGDSIQYVETEYFPSGKKKSIEPILNEQTHGDIYIFNETEDIVYIAHYDHGNKLPINDYYDRGVHTQYRVTEGNRKGTLIIESVSLADKEIEIDSKGLTWQKYTKNGLVIQASCVKGNEYGNYWTIQFIMSNFGRDYVDLSGDSLFISGKLKGENVKIEKIPMKTYMKKVNRKHASRQFWMGFAEGFVNADAGKKTMSGRVSVGNHTYHVESSYYDMYEWSEAQRKSKERLDAYSKYLMEERQEIADNYFRSQPINPRDPVFGVQCIKLVDLDEIHAELVISGQSYIFDWKLDN